MYTPPLIELGANVVIIVSNEHGVVIGRSQYLNGGLQYLVRYKRADGVDAESWWDESALNVTTT